MNTKSFIVLLILFLSPCLLNAFPSTINYQGVLTQQEDGKKIDGTIDMIFSIYDVENGGEALWSEKHFAIPVNAGHFIVHLGSQNGGDISMLPVDKDLYISINIGGEETNERVKLDTVIHAIFSKYSLEAQTVALNSIKPEHIQNKAITNEKIADNAVNTNQIANTSITNNKIADKTITANKINDGSGSNLNADLLDGKDSSDFVLKSESESLNKGTTTQLIAGEKINGAETPVPVYIRKDGLIIEQSAGNSNANVFGINKYAQTFQTDVSTTEIKSISLNLEKNGSPSGNINVAICEVTTSNTPKVSSLKEKTITANDISNGWNQFVFDSIVSVLPSTTYAIVVSVPNADASNNIIWKYSISDVYNNGVYLSSSDYGTNWNVSNDRDFSFEMHSTGRVYICAANVSNKLDFIGFAISNADIGENIKVQTHGIVSGFKGLDIGKKYYIQDGSGNIGTSAGSYKKMIAVALNCTDVTIFWSDSINISSETEALTGIDDTKVMTPLKTRKAILANRAKVYIGATDTISEIITESKYTSKEINMGFRPSYFKCHFEFFAQTNGFSDKSSFCSILEGSLNGTLSKLYTSYYGSKAVRLSPYYVFYDGSIQHDSSNHIASLSNPGISVRSYSVNSYLQNITITNTGLKFNFSHIKDRSHNGVVYYRIKKITAWE